MYHRPVYPDHRQRVSYLLLFLKKISFIFNLQEFYYLLNFLVYLFAFLGPQVGPARKNRPLCHETIRWRSDVPLTEGQLRSKRDEFWDTAPAFDGRKEIWDALRAATTAAEALDFQLAQAILDGANISVPNG